MPCYKLESLLSKGEKGKQILGVDNNVTCEQGVTIFNVLQYSGQGQREVINSIKILS